MADLIDGLFQLSFALQSALTKIAAAHDLSVIQVRMLGILRDREPGMLELARYLELEKSSLSGLVDRAAQRGLLERIPSAEDRRAATVRMTAKGKKLARIFEDEVRVAVEALVRPLADADQKKLATLIWRVLPPTMPA